MKVPEVRAVAKSKKVKVAGMKKEELIRAIQRAEGNFDCFSTAAAESCDQGNCLWKEDCLIPAK